MDRIVNRKFHEAIGEIVEVELTKELRKGEEYLEKVPYPFMQESSAKGIDITNEIVRDNDNKEKAFTEEEITEILNTKVNFNLPDTNLKWVEKIYIDSGDYWALYHMYRTQYPYKNCHKMLLYTYVRDLCKKPLTNTELKQIEGDKKCIKKALKLMDKKKMKKTGGNFIVKF